MYSCYCPYRVSYVQIRIADLYTDLQVLKNKIDFLYRFVFAEFKNGIFAREGQIYLNILIVLLQLNLITIPTATFITFYVHYCYNTSTVNVI